MSSFLLAPPPPVRGVVRALRRLAESAVSPLVPADYLDLVTPLRSGADLRGRVVAVEAETADAATIVVRPARSWRPHRAGQYVRVGVDIDGVRTLASRISYVGELGWEIYVPIEQGLRVWDAIWEAGRPHGLAPVDSPIEAEG